MRFLKKELKVSISRVYASIICRIALDGIVISSMSCVAMPDAQLLIGDITPFERDRYINKGYCSIMMVELLKYAAENRFCTVYGNLSVADLDHKDRLHAFYRKHGFTIAEYEEPYGMYYGELRKEL